MSKYFENFEPQTKAEHAPAEHLAATYSAGRSDLRKASPESIKGLGFPDPNIIDDGRMQAIAKSDGPRFRTDERLDSRVQVREPSEAGNAEQAIDLIRARNFQNPDGSLTSQAQESIRAAVANTGFFQTYEGRAAEVQRYINDRTAGANLSLQFDRDTANASTATGSRPFIRATIGERTTIIPMR